MLKTRGAQATPVSAIPSPVEGVPPPPAAPTLPMAEAPGSSPSSAPVPASPEQRAAQDLAKVMLWWRQQPWLKALAQSMPPGVTISSDAEPFDVEGWSDVVVREHHAPDSGFDPEVSPAIGHFRISRVGRKVQWMDPVAGEYQPLAKYLAQLEAAPPDATPPGPPPASPPTALSVTSGDFETPPPEIPDRDGAVIVADPLNPANHAARIVGPDEMSFTLPVTAPPGLGEMTVLLRLLFPATTKIIRFEDGRTPEGIRLRVRLLNELGNSVIRDAVVRPSDQWRDFEFNFYEPPKRVVQVSVEAIWMEGPVYVDDVKLVH
jgi:hypothetical protein